MVSTSILTSIKKLLGPDEEDEHFDPDIIMHINTTLMALCQMGVGPSSGFSIQDKTTTWSEYVGENANLEAIKTYIYMKVRLIFDPPSSAFVVEAMNATIKEIEWRITAQAEVRVP